MAATSPPRPLLSLFPNTSNSGPPRSNSNRSRSPVAKAPSAAQQHQVRSIFPQYNPDVPLDGQEYYPTQASPTHVPPSAISRPLYSPRPSRQAEAPVPPAISTTEELKHLWKVANGWRAPPGEGRLYAMGMTADKDAPVYVLSSASQQPFYNMTVKPTSTSAHMTLSRWDRPFRGVSTGSDVGWQEVLATTLEPEWRRRQRQQSPADGLVALLYPAAAMRLTLARPGDMTAVQRAEKECARLVWDADSAAYYLSHPALALPFRVAVDRRPAWSRVEYTLEHVESPHHVARLTCHTTGQGVLEVDTAVAARIDAVFFADVAVAALLLVAHVDAEAYGRETFEPPPPPMVVGAPDHDSMASREGAGSPEVKKPAKKSRMLMFDVDMASHELAKGLEVEGDDEKKKKKLPLVLRVVVKLLTVTFKSVIWIATMAFRAMTFVVAGCARCLSPQKT